MAAADTESHPGRTLNLSATFMETENVDIANGQNDFANELALCNIGIKKNVRIVNCVQKHAGSAGEAGDENSVSGIGFQNLYPEVTQDRQNLMKLKSWWPPEVALET